jgi:hypothetical protein
MATSKYVQDNEKKKFIESTSVSGQPGVVVLNPDGSNVGATVAISQTTPGTTNNVSVSGSTGTNTSALIKDDTAFGDGVTSGVLSTTSRLYNGSNYDRGRSITNGTNSTGTGIAASGLVAQLDDTSPTVITENSFGNLRIDTGRQLRVNNQSAPDATVLTPYSVRLTTNTTTTPVSSTVYISSIVLSSEAAGTTSTLTIQDKQGTPLKLVNGFTTVAVTTTPTIINLQTPVKMTSGIDIVTAGAVAATVDVWINYYV